MSLSQTGKQILFSFCECQTELIQMHEKYTMKIVRHLASIRVYGAIQEDGNNLIILCNGNIDFTEC